MRRNLLLFFTLIVSIGSISGQAEFISQTGASIDAARGASPNGKYLVGASLRKTAFIWDVEKKIVQNIAVENSSSIGTAYEVTNDGTVVGNFPDSTYMYDLTEKGVTKTYVLQNGGVWKDGKWTSLGLGKYSYDEIYSSNVGANARTISEDGNIVAGFSVDSVAGIGWVSYPYAWEYEDGEWNGRSWAFPDNKEVDANIMDLSADGKRASGWINTTFGHKGAIWKSKDECITPLLNGNLANFFQNISANGKYAVSKNSNKYYLYDIDNDRFITMDTGHNEGLYYYPTGVSNDGMVVGYFTKNFEGSGPYHGVIWTPKLGYMDFKDFIPLFIPDLIIDQALLNKVINDERGNYIFSYISGDGMILGGYIQNSRNKQPFILRLAGPVNILSFPKNLSANVPLLDRNKVELTWELEASEGDPLPVSYIIYRNEKVLETINADATTYTDVDAPVGYNFYNIQAVYPDDEKSRFSDKIYATVVDNYDLPFTEDFSSKTFDTNFWTTKIEKEGDPKHIFWRVFNDGGVGNGAGAGFNTLTYKYGYSSSMISKPLDADTLDSVQLSFMVRHFSPTYEFETSPDTLAVEVYDIETSSINEIGRVIVSYGMGWTSQRMNLSEFTVGKLFKLRFRAYGDNDSNHLKYMLLDDIKVSSSLSEGDAIPRDILLRSNDADFVNLAWKSPSSDMYGLTHTQTIKNDEFTNGETPFIAVQKFDTKDLKVYADNGLYFRSISAYIGETQSNPSIKTKLRLAVFVNDVRTVTQDLPEFAVNNWNTFELAEPIALNSITDNMKFGIDVVEYVKNQGVIGVDENNKAVPGKGDLYSTDGGNTWKLLSDLPSNKYASRNFCIVGNVSTLDNSMDYDDSIIGYELYRDGVKINNGLLFGQTYETEKVADVCYTVRAYSIESGISTHSVSKCAENFIINTSLEGEGSIDPEGNVSVMFGDDKTFTFRADDNFILSEVLVDDVNIPEAVVDGSYTFSNVTKGHQIVVKFVSEQTGIEDAELSEFSIYPNPTKGKLLITNTVAIEDIQLFDTTGRVIYTIDKIHDSEILLDLTGYINGIYLLKIGGKTFRIVKQ